MSGIRILVAEDDKNIRIGLVDTLESEGYNVMAADDGDQATALFDKGKYDLVVLDIMMPKKSGYDVCRDIRVKNETVPIIMLTAKGEEIDKVLGLQLGADDYVTKPFGVHELLARIAAALRRSRASARSREKDRTRNIPDVFTFGSAEIDSRKYKAKLGRRSFDLSARELRLLQLFKSCPNEVLSRDELLNKIWGVEYYGTTRTLDQHIAQLRKKVTPRLGKDQCIVTVHGVGYKYVEGEP